MFGMFGISSMLLKVSDHRVGKNLLVLNQSWLRAFTVEFHLLNQTVELLGSDTQIAVSLSVQE